jgi:hypothetical protein
MLNLIDVLEWRTSGDRAEPSPLRLRQILVLPRRESGIPVQKLLPHTLCFRHLR